MAQGNPNWGKDKAVDWRFWIRGKSPNGGVVTLGKFMEEKEATSRYDQLVQEGHYRKLRIEPIQPKASESDGKPK